MFGRRSDAAHHDYNPLAESLIIEGSDQDDGVTVNSATGFGNTREPPRRPSSASMTESLSRVGSRIRNFLSSSPAPSREGSWGGDTRSTGTMSHVDAPQARPRTTQTTRRPPMMDPRQLLEDCRATVNAARVSSELLRDTTREVRENPGEATDLAETLSQLSSTCMDQQGQLSMMLSNELVLSDEALLMQALEVNESLALALEGYLMLSTGDMQQALQPTQTAAAPTQTAQAPVPQESEEEMIARAMAESLRTEEERKAKADHENTVLLVDAVAGLAPPPPPPSHAPPPPPPPPPADANLLFDIPPAPPAPPAPAPPAPPAPPSPSNGESPMFGLEDLIAAPPPAPPASTTAAAPTNLLD
mmetsp:Transcript_5549/g.11316  ORF Transcript_5549/g.11316 Transcript_5549/m.11316 type:complete len:360 (-) Transcript_5549:292-1371(-)|eukprot:CAMPEP_0118935654 /NCGR_PEP_ID=MMETSP1169-20130426/15761_1 /TAXON_ID=36882 /ORGANISM="Pyramimonas obovata, Strain CCMP722" /LENGTH=359 /DNA_ID=CAMNT_0006878713 /DNA_START=124 /DNA_END=1203 /DNA_ORIENTATION=+